MSSVYKINQSCAICFEEFKENEEVLGHDVGMGLKTISHIFHVHCLNQVKQFTPEAPCPLCRADGSEFSEREVTWLNCQMSEKRLNLRPVPKDEIVERGLVEIKAVCTAEGWEVDRVEVDCTDTRACRQLKFLSILGFF